MHPLIIYSDVFLRNLTTGMKKITGYRRSAITMFIIVAGIFLLTQCVDKQENETTPTGDNQNIAKRAANVPVTRDQFAGSETCIKCHRDIYNKHILTAHYLTTRPAEEKYIKGSFATGKNVYVYDTSMKVVMEKRDSGFYQVGYYNGVEKIVRRFDIVVGSGSKGQTYIFKIGSNLFQLPVSYFTAAKEWANSPQFPVKPVLFNRAITSRCLECHSTFVEKTSAVNVDPEAFNTGQMIFGVDCEKCHGPAAKHVAFQTQNPKETTAKYIINPAKFTRQQSLDLCALCHGGRLHKTTPSFQFIAGDTLSNFFTMDNAPLDPTDIDVHGNQLGLLRASKCFRMSGTMTCLTCHDTHENERGKISLFSQRCMQCHNTQHGTFCKMGDSLGNAINNNCIDCHMPAKLSKSITELLPGHTTPTAALIRSHYISIYPDETKKFREKMKGIK